MALGTVTDGTLTLGVVTLGVVTAGVVTLGVVTAGVLTLGVVTAGTLADGDLGSVTARPSGERAHRHRKHNEASSGVESASPCLVIGSRC